MPKTLNIDLVKSWIRKKDIQSLKNHHDLLINSFYLQDDRGNTFLHYCAKKNNEIMAKFFLDFENNKMNQQELIRKHLQLTNKKMAQSLSAAENSARQAKKSKNMNVKKKDGASPARQAENDNDEQFNTMNKADAAVVAANVALLRGKSYSPEAVQNNNNSLSEHNTLALAIPEPVPHESEKKLFFGSKAPRLQMIQNKDGHLPIHIAAGHFEGNDKSSVLATLIEYDAYNHTNINSILVSLKFRDPHYHLTPLHEALLKKSQGAMVLLNEVYKFAEGSGNRHVILKHKMKSSDVNAPKKFIYKLLRELILAKDNYGENCLHYAAAYGCLEPLEKILEILREADILLDKDNNPNYNGPINYMKIANKSGKLPIHLAAKDGQNQIMQAECVNKLVDFEREYFGASRFGNDSGDTAVTSATAASTSKFYPFEHITSQLEIVDNEGYLALHIAIEGGHVAIVRTLLRVMKNNLPDIKFQKMLNQPTRETGSTPFLLAAKNGVEFVRLLHQNYNCDITSITDDGNNALMVAAEEDEPLVVEYLLERKLIDKSEFNCPDININDVNHNERSAFMLACCEGNVKVVDIFLTYYIRETQDGSRNYTPEDENGKCYLIPDNRKLKIDLEDDLECTVLHWIAHNFDDDIESYENILSKIHQKMDPGEWNIFGRKTDWQGNTAMHTACKRGNIDVVSFLINQGLLASIDAKNEYDQTPLMMAVNHNHYEIMKFLLKNSSNLTEDEDQNSNTALHIAAREGFLDICQTLVDYSADYHDKNQLGETALHLAAKHGRITICEYLLSLNSMEIDVLDKTNKTPLMLAAEFGSYQVVQFLLKKGAKPYLVTAKEEVWRNLENNEKNSKSQYLPIQQKIYKGGQNCLELAVDNNQYECAKAILLSDAWAECLRNVRFGKKGKIITPMRLLLTKYPDLAGIVLNRSVEYTDKKDHENGKETVRLNFEFIEDLYRIDWWHKRSGEDAHGSSFDGKNVIGLNDLVNDTKSKGPRSSAGSTSGRTMNKQKSFSRSKTSFAVSPTFSENQDSTEKLISRTSRDSKEDQIISVDVEPLSPNQVCEKTPLKLTKIFENTPKYDPDPIHINHDDIAQAKWTVPWSLENKSSPNSNKPFLETNMSIISSEKHGDSSDDDELYDGYNYNDYNGQLKPDAEMYGYEYVTRNKNDPKESISIEQDVKLDSQTYKSYHILSYIKRSRDVTLLRHPLVLALLRRKWNSYGKKYYWTDLIFYLAFVISLNAFCVFFTPPAYMFSNEEQDGGGLTSYDHFNIQQNVTECSKFQDYLLDANHTSDYYQTVGPQLCDPNSAFLRARFGVKWLRLNSIDYPLFLIFLSIRVIIELRSLWNQGWNIYFKDYMNYVEIILYSCTIFFISDLMFDDYYQILTSNEVGKQYANKTIFDRLLLIYDQKMYNKSFSVKSGPQQIAGAVAVFLSWLNLILFARYFPKFGLYILMFQHVFMTFLEFAGVLVIFVLAFSFTFKMLLGNQVAFHDFTGGLLTIFVWMIGELEYSDVILGSMSSDEFTSALNYTRTTQLIYLFFLVMISIVVMNLMTGLAVDDIDKIRSVAEVNKLAMLIDTQIYQEFSLPTSFHLFRKFRSYGNISYMKIHDYKKYCRQFENRNWFKKFFDDERMINPRDYKEAALNPLWQPIVDCDLDDLDGGYTSSSANTNNINDESGNGMDDNTMGTQFGNISYNLENKLKESNESTDLKLNDLKIEFKMLRYEMKLMAEQNNRLVKSLNALLHGQEFMLDQNKAITEKIQKSHSVIENSTQNLNLNHSRSQSGDGNLETVAENEEGLDLPNTSANSGPHDVSLDNQGNPILAESNDSNGLTGPNQETRNLGHIRRSGLRRNRFEAEDDLDFRIIEQTERYRRNLDRIRGAIDDNDNAASRRNLRRR